MKTKFIYISLMLFAFSSHGDPATQYNDYTGRGSGYVNDIKKATPQATATAPEQTTINQGAATGQGSQAGGAALNSAISGALIRACLAPCSRRCIMPLCAMGSLAMMQAIHDAKAAGQSGAAFDVSGFGKASNGTGEFDQSDLDLANAKLKEAGYTVTETGVKFPDGTTYGSNDLTSPAAMDSAGLDAKTSAEVQSIVNGILADATKDANSPKVSSVGVNGAGGSAGSHREVSISDNYGSGGYSLKAADQKKLIAGKTVMLDGEPIGVRGNNIFDMVHQAYQKRRQGNQFIETADNSGARTRTPASLPKLKPLVNK